LRTHRPLLPCEAEISGPPEPSDVTTPTPSSDGSPVSTHPANPSPIYATSTRRLRSLPNCHTPSDTLVAGRTPPTQAAGEEKGGGIGMASLGGMGAFGAAAAGRGATLAARATRASAAEGSGQEKGPFDWVLGLLQKNQLVETDPILKKVEEKSGSGTTSRGGTTSVAVPKKPGGFGGFGGLFAKK
ncbi:hypothetical protein Taro_024103, partial [Colocasia esculenta]|nr:hypothetical protein [Colocasia esculenta]